ncbi:MAG: alkaline phosphatase family protein [Nitrosopumilus sp.]|nr:alkaline phosphatase family protein [Nitrosopumilus sp.]
MSKVTLIGLDAAIPNLVKNYFKMGKLPTMQKFSQEGTFAELIPVFPTHTASNWNTVSTGAWPKTHGVTDMVIHFPGTPLTEIKSGFYSNFCKAEQIWKTAEKNGKKSILMKYIASWPPNIENVLQVEGFGAPGGPGSRPWGSSPSTISNSSCYSNKEIENGKLISFKEADLSSWNLSNDFESNIPPKEGELKLGIEEDVKYDILLIGKESSKYDTVIITKNKDVNKGFQLKKGFASEWLKDEFRKDGKNIWASFRLRLIELDEMAEEFKIYVTQIFPLEGWTYPESIAKELVEECGPFLESISHFPYAFGWVDENAYVDDMDYQAKWLGKATQYLMKKDNWDLYMTQWHGIDNTEHAFLRFDKSTLSEHEKQVGEEVTLKSYQIADQYVKDILEGVAQSSNNEESHTIILSDHGQVMGKRRFFINAYLYEKGFIKLKRDSQTKKITIDWKNTRAFAQGMVSVYVNLKGRDPEGSVNPGKEYEDVVRDLINILYDVKDPKTNQRPIIMALSNQDAEFIGLSGERVGDLVVAANPVYALDNRVKVDGRLFEDLKTGLPDGSIHGAQLPALDLKENGMIKSLFIAQGPKIKKDYTIEKPISMINIAPTIAHLLDIPPPKNCEGVVIKEMLE